MKINEKIVILIFGLYLIDKYLDRANGLETDYNAWIMLFLFWIAYNTASKK